MATKTRVRKGQIINIWRCSGCGRWEGEYPQAGCCAGCGIATEPERYAVRVEGRS